MLNLDGIRALVQHRLRPRLRPADARRPIRRGPEDPRHRGSTLLRRLREQPATPAVIALAEEGNELTAVRALQLGAVDYLPKRLLTPERLSTAVCVALRRVERRVARRLASLANLSRDAERMRRRPRRRATPPSPGGAREPAGEQAGCGRRSARPAADGVAALLDDQAPRSFPATRCG